MLFAFAAVSYLFSVEVYAADAVTAFGSNYYTGTAGEGEFPLGIYIRSDEAIGEYHLELRYDNTRLDYISGADDEEDGLLTLDGTGNGTEVKVLLYFEAVSGGGAGIVFTAAEVYGAENGERLAITEYDYAPITIAGEDTAGASFEDLLDEMENEDAEDGENAIHEEGSNGTELPAVGGVVDLEDYGEDAGESGVAHPGLTAGAADAEESGAGEGDTVENGSSAFSIYEQSKRQTVEDNQDEMWRIFFGAVVLLVVLCMAAGLIIFLQSRKKRRMEKTAAASQGNQKTFPFEFETIPEEEDNKWRMQIKYDINQHEKRGKNTKSLEFKKLLPNEQEIEYIDLAKEENADRENSHPSP